jgi:hypothetical protein
MDTLTVEQVELDQLHPHPQNYRSHPDEQLHHIRESLLAHGYYRPVVVARDNTILAGHGVVQAAQELGLTVAPVVRLDLDPMDPRALKVLTGDNELARIAIDDDQLLVQLLEVIQAEDQAGLLGTGYDDDSLAALQALLADENGENGSSEPRQNIYTAKVDTPLYEPTGDQPELGELIGQDRYNTLVQGIAAAGLDPEVQAFLMKAATRHLVFDYQKIAEWYCHADPQVQRLMEDSALVIIDLNRAIELGYAALRDDMIDAVEDARDAWGS